eukprot:TRINITY_DN43790_c0_g1_i1.p1 TRINITY_DN43790_c0_g1~~TRINITY_DN43790_c0_g1_i1.p1  ORF type:complete len:113 (-),score=11.43 TRINITY_DN43790_c0_g1_i1:60-374(-)
MGADGTVLLRHADSIDYHQFLPQYYSGVHLLYGPEYTLEQSTYHLNRLHFRVAQTREEFVALIDASPPPHCPWPIDTLAHVYTCPVEMSPTVSAANLTVLSLSI